MVTVRSNSRAMTTARDQVLTQLIDDHKRIKKAYKDFQKLGADSDPAQREALVQRVLKELSIHAALEEELLYPAAHGVAEEGLVDEAEVEHESVHALIEQLEGMAPEDEKYAARFTVLCEYVLHHVKEEEGEMFPQLAQGRMDWPSLAEQMTRRRAELGAAADEESAMSANNAASRKPPTSAGRSSKNLAPKAG